MTTPNDSGAVDTTPSATFGAGNDASGYGGADQLDAPDLAQGFMHAPGSTPQTAVLSGPAEMSTNDTKSSKKSNKK